MFSSKRTSHYDSFSKQRSGKAISKSKRSFRDQSATRSRTERIKKAESSFTDNTLNSPIVTLVIGPEGRLFACHESVLSHSAFFAAICREQLLETTSKRIDLPEEVPEVFSSILEYLYKGDYYPRLLHDKRRNSWELEDTSSSGGHDPTVFHPMFQQLILKDTAIYCAADRYGLEELKRLSLRKQNLQSGIQCSSILTSARYAYANTPESDSKLRAHYLALIIRSRSTFKRSGTMQMEMEAGGKLFFDLFVALVNHLDDVAHITKTPR